MSSADSCRGRHDNMDEQMGDTEMAGWQTSERERRNEGAGSKGHTPIGGQDENLKLLHPESEEGAGWGGKCMLMRFMGQLWQQYTRAVGGRSSLSDNSVRDPPFNHDDLLYIHKEIQKIGATYKDCRCVG